MEQQLVWALPEALEVPPDKLRLRLDIYEETILLHRYGQDGTTTRAVSALEVARAFTRELSFHSSVLPQDALWWGTGPEGDQVALWRKPTVWKVALVLEAFQPSRRFTLPMPGLIFICSPGRAPRVYATAKRRPTDLGAFLYHAPLFNVFHDGRTCPGTHGYPQEVGDIPESFFTSFFTRAGDSCGRSKRHPDDLLALWQELDGRRRYPLRDLVPLGTLASVLGVEGR